MYRKVPLHGFRTKMTLVHFYTHGLKRRGLSQGSALQASVFRNFHFLGVIFPKNQKNFAGSAEIPAKTKMLNNFLLAQNRP